MYEIFKNYRDCYKSIFFKITFEVPFCYKQMTDFI